MLDIYDSLDSAGHSLKRMWQRGKIHRVGLLCESERGGRPLYVYFTRRMKVDNLAHEVGLTRVLLALKPSKSVRGDKTNRILRPDAEVTIGDQFLLLEYDTGSMSVRQVRETRFSRVYANYEEPVLWICKDEDRREDLRGAAKSVAHNAWFSTEAAVIADPFGSVWTDYYGNLGAIEKAVENPIENS